MRRALLPDALPAAQQHPRLAEADRRGAAAGGLRARQATNTFPEICGRICPQDRLCEGNCVIEQSGHGTVTIGAVEKYITDTAWEEGWVEPIRPAERPESVGIIGAGPGGLAAADVLRRAGVQVTVYDRYDRAGGLMTYGIRASSSRRPW
jgi:glutamate synthase (NADPH) small chain